MSPDDHDASSGAQDQAEAAAQAFAAMSEAEAMDWIHGDDRTSVAGIPLTGDATRLLDECASLLEVQGFGLGTGLELGVGGASPELQALITRTVDKSSPKLFAACCNGTHFKSGKIT